MSIKTPLATIVALASMLALVTPLTDARADEPFASVGIRFESDCPFACDSFVIILSGEYTSSNWQAPHFQRIGFTGTSIIAYLDISYDPTPGLPVLTPLELRIPHGPLPEGRYTVALAIGFFNEPVPVPNLLLRDTITIAPPGDLNCDRVTDISDVVTSINQTFRSARPPDPPERGDLTCDSHRDILDVLQLIDYVLRAGSVCGPCQLRTPPLIMTDIPPESLAVDSFSVWGVQLDGDSLRVQYAFGDRCLTHHFALFMSPSTFEGPVPRIAHIYPVYHDHNDNCEALVVEWISTGLEGMRRSYQTQHPGDPGPIILRVHHYNSPVYVDLIYDID